MIIGLICGQLPGQAQPHTFETALSPCTHEIACFGCFKSNLLVQQLPETFGSKMTNGNKAEVEEQVLEELILQTIHAEGGIKDTIAFAKANGIDHKKLAGTALSLHSLDYIIKEVAVLLD